MNNKGHQICSRCVMDSTDMDISFDADGHCNHCTEYLENRLKLSETKPDPEALSKLFSDIKQRNTGKGNKYDAVIGLSGGSDSTYAAYLAHSYGLKLLAVHVDNGWNLGKANLNIKKFLDITGIDYKCVVLPWKNFSELLKAYLNASVPEADAPSDIAIYKWQLEIASENNIKDIISGGNMSSEGILPASWHYNDRDLAYAKSILSLSGLSLSDYSMVSCGFKRDAYFRLFKKIKFHSPLNFSGYQKDEAKKELALKYNWVDYDMKHGESKYTRFLQSYYMYEKHGIDYRKTWMSCNICRGILSREDALKELELLPYDPEKIDEDLIYIAKKLNMSSDQLRAIVSLPGKWHTDYPNNKFILGKMYDLYRLVFRKEKLTNF